MRAIISIHDVMPATLPQTRSIIARLPADCRNHLLLLVVPGLDWDEAGIAQLRAWQDQGCILVGHGWTHEVRYVRGWYHRLHAWLVSRRAAEHLSLSGDEIATLMCRNHAWFEAHGLRSPDYYVPPAWALGDIGREALARTPYRYLETTGHIHDVRTGAMRLLPLLGFEADTALRKIALGAFNQLNALAAALTGRTLRIAIHPFDFDYRLATQLSRWLDEVEVTEHYSMLFESSDASADVH